MSGICGIVRLDRKPVGVADLAPLLARLETRGPDRSHAWADGSAALGHTLLATTPEAEVERLPLRHAESGCTITADVRLDNRADLIAALGLQSAEVVGDAELILLSFLKWGEDCVSHLLGDFAFAIWDERRRRLFCARDHIGMRQLCYAELPGRAFIFATEPPAILAHPEVPQDLNLGRIADYLEQLETRALSETFYAHIRRLPPAHTLIVDERAATLRNYWRLTMPDRLVLRSDEQYAEAFLDIFEQSVRARLRCSGKVGAMLSGGLDSGSAAAVAAELLEKAGKGPLPTFSAVGSDRATCPETRSIHASAGMRGLAPQLLCHTDQYAYRDELRHLLATQSDPFDRHMTMIRTIYLAAQRGGVRVLLDGVSSDVMFSATGNVGRHLRDGAIAKAWREARDLGRYWDMPTAPWTLLSRGAWNAWAPRNVQHAKRRLTAWARDRRIGATGPIGASGLQARRREARAGELDRDYLADDLRARSIMHPSLVVGRERYDRVAASIGIEPRDPFIDRRVISFCLSLPREQLQAHGWPKIILRRAMAGRLPDEVRWRRGREHLGHDFTRTLLAGWEQPRFEAANVSPQISSALRALKDCQPGIEKICLTLWLKSQLDR